MSDFWESISFSSSPGMDSVLGRKDTLQRRASHSVRELTDAYRDKISLRLPVDAGTRVAFITNVGSVLTYKEMPEPHTEGTVVSVRTASGDRTATDEGLVFVQWDRGGVIPIRAEHLSKEATSPLYKKAFCRRVADLGNLSEFYLPQRSMVASLLGDEDGGELIHKATKDLWSFRKDGEAWVIERLFDEDGSPLKV